MKGGIRPVGSALFLALASILIVVRSFPAQGFPELPDDASPGSGEVIACNPPGVEGAARCGVFRVWEDREAQAGSTLDIVFVILDALEVDERQPDPVVLLPGGPGQPLVAGAAFTSDGFRAARRHRDILLIDVRGVGRSEPLSCDVPFPGGLRSRFDALFPIDHAEACRDELATRARLDLYTTASSVDDIEEIRRWLGYDRVNLDGSSYGTRVAQIYMRRHPEAIRTVVLNGVAPVSEPLYVQHAALLQRALTDLIAECEGQEPCRGAYPELRSDVEAVLDRFAQGPAVVRIDGETVPFPLGGLSYAIRGLLYDRGAEIPRILSRAAAGEVQPLAEYYLERTDWVGSSDEYAGYHYSVLCAEDVAVVSDELVSTATADTFMGDRLIQAYRGVCAVWPDAELPADHWQPVRSDIPTLLLSGSRDPVTPPEGAELVSLGLTNSLSVVVPNGGHVVWGPCLESLTVELLRTASVAALDPSCVAAIPPTEFVLPRR